jgi:sugar lactone lactonase YvrE
MRAAVTPQQISTEETKIRQVEESIRIFVRVADPKFRQVVPMRFFNLTLTRAEADASSKLRIALWRLDSRMVTAFTKYGNCGQESFLADVGDLEVADISDLPARPTNAQAPISLALERVEVLVEHADLSGIARGSINDMIVAVDGTAYVGDMGARLSVEGGERVPGQSIRVAPDGAVSCAADDLASPNGHILADDGRTLIIAESAASRLTAFDVHDDGTLANRRTYAELVPEKEGVSVAAPDGICLDAEGAVWVADPVGGRVFRVREGGEVTDSISFAGVIPVACVLGGPDRRTLFMCVAAHWKRDIVTAARTGRIDACEVDVPGAGRP